MIAFQWTSAGPQLIIYRANDILSLVQHDGSYCQSIWDATHVSLLITCFRKHWFLQKTNPLWFINMNPFLKSLILNSSVSYSRMYFLTQFKKLLWELSHRSQLLILHWKWLNYLRFIIFKTVMQLPTSHMCMTYSTMIAIVLPLTFL